MRKKIIIAVDQSRYSRYAMEYAIKVAKIVKAIDFVLLHIQPMISQYLTEEAKIRPKANSELKKVYENNKKFAYQLLEDCKTFMVGKGVDDQSIEMKTQAREHSIADDIFKVAATLSCDAILVGRRGVTGLQELFVGSVTSNLLACSHAIPLWIVGGIVPSNKILVAVDGSPPSLRAVDHLAFIFSEDREVQFQFLNIEPRIGDICEINTKTLQTAEIEKAILNSNEKCISDFSAKAMAILEKSGFTRNQVSFLSVEKKFLTSKAIVDAAKKGDFGTLVIGKTGVGENHNLGKVATRLVQKTSDIALWMVP